MDFFVSLDNLLKSVLLECLKFCDMILGVDQYQINCARYSRIIILSNVFNKTVFVIV